MRPEIDAPARTAPRSGARARRSPTCEDAQRDAGPKAASSRPSLRAPGRSRASRPRVFAPSSPPRAPSEHVVSSPSALDLEMPPLAALRAPRVPEFLRALAVQPSIPPPVRSVPPPTISVRPASARRSARPSAPAPAAPLARSIAPSRLCPARASMAPRASLAPAAPVVPRTSIRPRAKPASRWTRMRFALAFVAVLGGATQACALQTDPDAASREAELAASPIVAPYLTAPGGKACTGSADAVAISTSIARVRAMAGLPAIDCVDSIGAASQAHAGYMATNGVFTHTETEGKPGFTGENPGDRLEHAHYAGSTGGEIMSQQTGAASVDSGFGYLNSVYHRAMLLRVETTAYGYGESAAGSVIDLGRPEDAKQQAQRVIWPPNGATNVPTTYHAGNEAPNPVAPIELAGSPISLMTGQAFEAVDVVLTGPQGRVDATLITHVNDPAKLVRVGEAHLVPKAPLSPSTKYVVLFAFRQAGAPVTLQTTFTTGPH